jgi:hypothetical protein
VTQDAENAVLRAVFLRAASVGNVIAMLVEDGEWYIQVDWTQLTDDERHILTRIAVSAP